MEMQLPNDYDAVCHDQTFRTFCLFYEDVCLPYVSQRAVNLCPGKQETNWIRDLLLLTREVCTSCNC